MSFDIIPVAEASVETLIKSIDRVIINPIIFFMFACAIVYFLYGMVQYLLSPGNEEVHKKSKSIMLWGTMGLFIIVAVFKIEELILNTLGENKIKINNNGDYVVEKVQIDKNGNINAVSNTKLEDRKTPSNDGGDLLNPNTAPQIPIEVFTTSPFATYKSQPSVCWNKVFLSQADTEYQALSLVKAESRKQYLNDNKVLATDADRASYPIRFSTKVLYDKVDGLYYAWLDARAPLSIDPGETPMSARTVNKCDLEVIKKAPMIPVSVFVNTIDEVDLNTGANIGEPSSANGIVNYTTSPFVKKYKPSPMCWREEVYVNALSEYEALKGVKAKARNDYIKDNNLIDNLTPKNLPITYGTYTAYDKSIKNYYSWLDVRAPINGGKETDCNLVEIGQLISQSKKKSPFTKSYVSDKDFYRVVESGVNPDYSVARDIAINNALLQIALLKGFDIASPSEVRTILEERYYARDPLTGNYDYWVAIESPK